MKIIRVYRPDEDRQIEALLLLLRSTASTGAEARRPRTSSPGHSASPAPTRSTKQKVEEG